MKKYLLFYYRGYYPQGAFNDCIDGFGTAEEVFDYIQSLPEDMKEEVNGGRLEFQIMSVENLSILKLDDIKDISKIKDETCYKHITKNLYFDDEIEEYRNY